MKKEARTRLFCTEDLVDFLRRDGRCGYDFNRWGTYCSKAWS